MRLAGSATLTRTQVHSVQCVAQGLPGSPQGICGMREAPCAPQPCPCVSSCLQSPPQGTSRHGRVQVYHKEGRPPDPTHRNARTTRSVCLHIHADVHEMETSGRSRKWGLR